MPLHVRENDFRGYVRYYEGKNIMPQFGSLWPSSRRSDWRNARCFSAVQNDANGTKRTSHDVCYDGRLLGEKRTSNTQVELFRF